MPALVIVHRQRTIARDVTVDPDEVVRAEFSIGALKGGQVYADLVALDAFLVGVDDPV